MICVGLKPTERLIIKILRSKACRIMEKWK